eukprot:CAMPEP_0118947696 /NCGR_PEP_ID=MMETSP1169-20130426/46519_1 /TAXON_ID=36882 /ORGANISM="Pyramimonas obovata, Strain CCMP722" /LENGTH=164 /DNA_ID=CAMNT_0006893963 /DNA_START=663 /DNA_END=1156 /DNA_ORIENTATION=-
MAANSLDSDSEKNDFVVAGASIRTSLYSLTLISIFFLSSAARKDDSPKVFASGFTPVFLACPPRVALRCFLTTLAPFASFFAFGELGLWLAMMRDTSAAKSFSLSSSSPESSSAAVLAIYLRPSSSISNTRVLEEQTLIEELQDVLQVVRFLRREKARRGMAAG